jgi:hypothetical protein
MPEEDPTRKIFPADACCAVGPDGKIDIDMVRRTRAGAEYVATQTQQKAWPHLVRAGWRTMPVRVIRAGGPEDVEGEILPDAPPPAPRAAVAGAPRRRLPETISAAAYRKLVGADGGMLRCGVPGRGRTR